MLKNLGRQGELLIKRMNKKEVLASNTLKKLNHRVLAEGEATGHKHELTTGTLYNTSWGNKLFIELDTPAELKHPEHNTLDISRGFFEVITQREFNDIRVRD